MEEFAWINIIFFLSLAFGQVGEQNKAKTGEDRKQLISGKLKQEVDISGLWWVIMWQGLVIHVFY